ncbi:MAG: sigma-70 family RNA polymerase sigma factor [Bacillota bacterium]
MENHQAKSECNDIRIQEYCRTRDLSLRNELVDEYLYIAKIAAKKFAGRGVEYDDLLQTATLALIKALERYDHTRNVMFSTFASPCVIGEIKNYFRDKSRSIRLPRRNGELLKQVEKVVDSLAAELGAQPKPGQVAERMNISVELVHELMEARSRSYVVSLDDPIGESDDSGWSISDTMGTEEAAYSIVEDKDFFNRIMDDLSIPEQQFIKQRYINGNSQKEIALAMNVSQMYVSRMEKKLIERLRKYL